jgi:hypothetical protein
MICSGLPSCRAGVPGRRSGQDRRAAGPCCPASPASPDRLNKDPFGYSISMIVVDNDHPRVFFHHDHETAFPLGCLGAEVGAVCLGCQAGALGLWRGRHFGGGHDER